MRLLRRTLPPAPRRELWTGSLGLSGGLVLTAVLTRWLTGTEHLALFGPLGATALLLFFIPASPLVQPWPVLGGNLVSAVIGLLAHALLGASVESAALAGGCAAAAMFTLRCLHPPGAAVAILTALGSAALQRLGWMGVLWQVLSGCAVMLAMAVVFSRAVGRRYPHHGPLARVLTSPPTPALPGVTREDVQAALASFGEPLDIDPQDLEEVLHRAEEHARVRLRQKLLARN